MFETQYIR